MSAKCLLNSLVFVIFVHGSIALSCPEKKPVLCYWASWSTYRPGNGKHGVQYIIPEYCTHLVYTFAGLNLDGNIDILDSTADIINGGYKNFVGLKVSYPCVKTLIAIGGWNEGSEKYSLVAETAESREKFANGVLRFLIYYNFDGLDFDWEYPTQRGGLPEDKNNFVELLKILKNTLKKRNRILTAAVTAAKSVASDAYNIKEMCQIIDYLSIMAYDLHNPTKTSIHTPLYLENGESADRPTIDSIIQYYKSSGCPTEKLLLGISTFGRSYTLKNNLNNQVGAPITGLGKAGPYTRESGYLGFNEISELQVNQTGWNKKYLEQNAAVFAWRDKLWVSYDDIKTVEQKVLYALKENLAGIMVWTIDQDDFQLVASEKEYPILLKINEVLGNK